MIGGREQEHGRNLIKNEKGIGLVLCVNKVSWVAMIWVCMGTVDDGSTHQKPTRLPAFLPACYMVSSKNNI